MKKTEWRGQDCPPLYEMQRNGGMMQLTIYANVHQEEPADKDGSELQTEADWVADALTLPVGVMDYGSIVSAYINAKYNNDQMQAIVNNYLAGEDTEKFEEMQAYRVWAKTTARQIVGEISALTVEQEEEKEA